MNPRERIITAIHLKEPDRVPILEWIIDPSVYKAILPDAQTQADFEDAFDFDAVCCRTNFKSVKENADNTYVDEWGVTYKQSQEVVGHPIRGPIETPEDLKNYSPPDPDVPERLGRLPELVKRFKGQRAIIFVHRSEFIWSAYLNNLDNLLMNFILEPQFVSDIMDTVLDVNIRISKNAIRAGAEIIMLGDDYAGNNGPLMSPDIFKKFIKPRLKKMVQAVHDEGALVIKHSDGNLWPILDDIIDTGVDGINPIEPVAGMDIGEVKEKYGDKVCVIGNIDCGYLLSHGSEEEVRLAVKDCISKTGKRGGFILSSSNSIHSSVNPKNYFTMIKACKEYGRYPLKV